MLLFVYIAQGFLLFIDRFMDPKKLLWLFMACFAAVIIGLTSHIVFWIVLSFYFVFFSRTCRISDYGFSYHFIIIVAVGFTYGVFLGFLIGLVPLLFIPYIRPDLQIIDIITTAILLTLVGIASGIIGYISNEIFIISAIIMLIVYNIARMIALYGKLSMVRVSLPFFINIALNYYLIQIYLIKLMELIGYIAPV